MKFKSKGFTLIEIMVSTAILSVLLSIIFSIFISTQKNIKKTEIKSELQLNAKKLLECINRTMQAGYIYSISNNNVNFINSTSENLIIDNIVLKNDDGETFTFNLDKNTHKLFYNYNNGQFNKSDVIENVNDIKVSIINGELETTYKECKSLKLSITLAKNGPYKDIVDYVVTTNIYFRNAN